MATVPMSPMPEFEETSTISDTRSVSAMINMMVQYKFIFYFVSPYDLTLTC